MDTINQNSLNNGLSHTQNELVALPLPLRDLSDNLRNPLTGIMGNLWILRENSILTRQQRDCLEDIDKSCTALQILADKLNHAKVVSASSS